MITITDFNDLRETITQYIVENNYFSNYDIDTNDIVQMIIDIFSYITSNVSTSLVTAENNTLLYSSQDPDTIMNLLPLFGYSPNFGIPQQQYVNMSIPPSQVTSLMTSNPNIANAILTAPSNSSFVLYSQYSNITITSPVYNYSTTSITTVQQSLNWILLDSVIVYSSDIIQAYNNGVNTTSCPVYTLSGNSSIHLIQQNPIQISFSNVAGLPFERFLIEESISAKSLIINYDKLNTGVNYNFTPSLLVTLNNNTEIYNVYSSILDASSTQDNFVLLYYDPVSNMLYLQSGDNNLNGNVIPQGADIALNFYETVGNTIVPNVGSLNSSILASQNFGGYQASVKINLVQPTPIFGGKLYSSINDIKKQALILGNINNRLVTNRDYQLYVNYYLTNLMPYSYSTCNIISAFGENSIYIMPLVQLTNELYSLQFLNSQQQNQLLQQVSNIVPASTYVIIQNPILYYLTTVSNSSISIIIENSISLNNAVQQITSQLDNYFSFSVFNPFQNFDVIDFVTQLNQVPSVIQIDYNSVSTSLALVDANNKVRASIDSSVSNSIISIPQTQLNSYTQTSSSFQAITLTSSSLTFDLYYMNAANQKSFLGQFQYPQLS